MACSEPLAEWPSDIELILPYFLPHGQHHPRLLFQFGSSLEAGELEGFREAISSHVGCDTLKSREKRGYLRSLEN